MSIGSIGVRGLPDDQAVVDWGTGKPAWSLTTQQTGTITSPAIDTGGYGYVYSNLIVAGNPVHLHTRWFVDEALTIECGRRSIVLDPSITNAAQLAFANLGPWLRYDANPATGATVWTPTFFSFLTNSVHPLEVRPVDEANKSAVWNIAASGARTDSPGDYYGGPVGFYMTAGNTQLSFSLQLETSGFGWREFALFTLAATTTNNVTIEWPATSVRIVITNLDGVNANTAGGWVIVPSATGS